MPEHHAPGEHFDNESRLNPTAPVAGGETGPYRDNALDHVPGDGQPPKDSPPFNQRHPTANDLRLNRRPLHEAAGGCLLSSGDQDDRKPAGVVGSVKLLSRRRLWKQVGDYLSKSAI